MTISAKIGFLGAGNMAQAILRGLLDKKIVIPSQVICSDISESVLAGVSKKYKILTTLESSTIATKSEILLLCIKPQDLSSALKKIAGYITKSHRVISVVAGVPLRFLQKQIGETCPIIRAMPNMAAMVFESATAFVANEKVTSAFLSEAMEIFNAIGRTIYLTDENLMDVVTGLSGSGPAYALSAIEAMAQGATRLGMKREEALLLASQTLFGAAKLCLETGEAPEKLIARITSKGGTTIAGLEALKKAGFASALMDAVDVTTRRSKELGKETLQEQS